MSAAAHGSSRAGPASRAASALRLLAERFDRRFIFLVGVLVWPWLLLCAAFGPSGTRDPDWAWGLTASAFLVTGLLARLSPLPEVALQRLFYGCSWLVTAHLMILAHANGMHPFYAVGSVMAIVTTSMHCRSRAAFAAYGIFVLALGTTSFALAPDPTKAAFWFGMVLAMVPAWYRLTAYLEAATTVERQQEALETRVRERTAELEHANRQLRHEIEERELLEQQLQLSQKMEAVGRLAGGVAHDFNNLLTVIRSYADFLLAALPSDPLRADALEIVRAGERASQLTSQLVTFTRGGVTQPVVLDPNEVLGEFAGMLRSLAGEDVEVHLECADDLLRMRADRGQVEQVILNLALNARDAMPEGGKLSIATCNVAADAEEVAAIEAPPPPHGWVRLTVSDTGLGMSPETRSRAFEPFFTTKGVGKGTGLGLAIVYGIVEQAGGHVRLSSEPGQGTRFDLYFPALRLASATRLERAPVDAPPANGECVLLVEDDPGIRRAAKRALREAGFTVLEAEDGDVALVILEATRYDVRLVLADVVMPHLSGFDLADRVPEVRPGTPVLLMSGHLNHPSLRDREIPPDTAILAKPFTPAELVARVRAALWPPEEEKPGDEDGL